MTGQNEREFARSLGRSIADARRAKGLTQEKLADVIGVEQESISRLERGVTLPSLSRLMHIADVLAVPIASLIRSSSGRSVDQAQDLVEKLNELSGEDRAWVRRWVDEICSKLALQNKK
ncbi:helix-turn-helix domain-containing protein [Chromobacterium haemolyticum]|uniref:helix-turn-helix domain-containing protein n=1 Tax=Chromobacterium haemolyticum TaxID=394935 RepID=UPI0005B86119|nr:helix-turn-helix transcriptional regulator [Chromobacterium haemolyticum]